MWLSLCQVCQVPLCVRLRSVSSLPMVLSLLLAPRPQVLMIRHVRINLRQRLLSCASLSHASTTMPRFSRSSVTSRGASLQLH